MRSSFRSGLTLVEVVAGLALLGSLLSVVLIGGSKHLRQIKFAEQKRASVRELDQFLTSWAAAGFDLDLERIEGSTAAARLPVSGAFGSHVPVSDGQARSDDRQIEVSITQRSQLYLFLRATVTAPDALGARQPTAWAEIVIPNRSEGGDDG